MLDDGQDECRQDAEVTAVAVVDSSVVVPAQCICGNHLGAAGGPPACVIEVAAACTHIHGFNIT